MKFLVPEKCNLPTWPTLKEFVVVFCAAETWKQFFYSKKSNFCSKIHQRNWRDRKRDGKQQSRNGYSRSDHVREQSGVVHEHSGHLREHSGHVNDQSGWGQRRLSKAWDGLVPLQQVRYRPSNKLYKSVSSFRTVWSFQSVQVRRHQLRSHLLLELRSNRSYNVSQEIGHSCTL